MSISSGILAEILGVLTALIYLYFSVKQKVWLWPFGILTSSFYIVVFFSSRLYADMGLQVYYLLISVYGWYYWLFSPRKKEGRDLPVSRMNKKQMLLPGIVALLLYAILVLALSFIPRWLGIPPSDIIYWDAFTTSLSIIATWMLARKLLEHWLLWIVVDTVSFFLYIYKGLYYTAFLFFIYTLIAVYGYFEWKKTLGTPEKDAQKPLAGKSK